LELGIIRFGIADFGFLEGKLSIWDLGLRISDLMAGRRAQGLKKANVEYRIMNVERMYSARRELLCRTVYFIKK
jgi:hypothetical protein